MLLKEALQEPVYSISWQKQQLNMPEEEVTSGKNQVAETGYLHMHQNVFANIIITNETSFLIYSPRINCITFTETFLFGYYLKESCSMFCHKDGRHQ